MRRITALLASLGLVLTLVPTATLAAPAPAGTWIVTLRDGIDPSSAAPHLVREVGGRLGFTYDHVLNGFSFRGSSAAATALGRNPNVANVEADAEVWLEDTQSGATWGLDRIDQRAGTNGSYVYNATGAGVTAYVIDSGIRTSHGEFDGRALAFAEADFVGDGQEGQDCNGHGTHVAGTIGGQTYGVAKEITLVSVRVFGCTGGSSWSTIIAGIDWAAKHHGSGPAVANLSLGGGASASVDDAVRDLIADGVATAVAAGNGDWLGRQANACNYSPARVTEAMTISATDKTDTKASWANYGSCVDWFAPGVSITSAVHSSDTATGNKSGTSMATPHTAGVAALYLDLNESASPQQVRDAIFEGTTKDIVKSSNTANDHLLYTGFIGGTGGGGGGGNTSPTANPASATTDEGVGVSITLTGADVETCDLAFSIVDGPDNGNLGAITPQSCVAGSPNRDSATVTYTPSSSADDSFTFKVSDGTTDSAPATVTIDVVSTSTGGIALSVAAYKSKGYKAAELSWSGASSTTVDLYFDGALLATTANDGAHTHTTTERGGGDHTYKVCEAGTSTCSNEATASY